MLPEHIELLDASVAAGHLSSSSIYPACFAPYLISTACNDRRVRFWCCQYKKVEDQMSDGKVFEWKEWEMMMKEEDTSAIKIHGEDDLDVTKNIIMQFFTNIIIR